MHHELLFSSEKLAAAAAGNLGLIEMPEQF